MLPNFSHRNVERIVPLLLTILLAIFLTMSVIQASAMDKETSLSNLSHCNAFAKWFHTEEFSDLYPRKTFKELHDQFLPIEASGVFGLPSNNSCVM